MSYIKLTTIVLACGLALAGCDSKTPSSSQSKPKPTATATIAPKIIGKATCVSKDGKMIRPSEVVVDGQRATAEDAKQDNAVTYKDEGSAGRTTYQLTFWCGEAKRQVGKAPVRGTATYTCTIPKASSTKCAES